VTIQACGIVLSELGIRAGAVYRARAAEMFPLRCTIEHQMDGAEKSSVWHKDKRLIQTNVHAHSSLI
jgi:hypothetical protein